MCVCDYLLRLAPLVRTPSALHMSKTRIIDLVARPSGVRRLRPGVTCVQKAATRSIAAASDVEAALGTTRAEETGLSIYREDLKRYGAP